MSVKRHEGLPEYWIQRTCQDVSILRVVNHSLCVHLLGLRVVPCPRSDVTHTARPPHAPYATTRRTNGHRRSKPQPSARPPRITPRATFPSRCAPPCREGSGSRASDSPADSPADGPADSPAAPNSPAPTDGDGTVVAPAEDEGGKRGGLRTPAAQPAAAAAVAVAAAAVAPCRCARAHAIEAAEVKGV